MFLHANCVKITVIINETNRSENTVTTKTHIAHNAMQIDDIMHKAHSGHILFSWKCLAFLCTQYALLISFTFSISNIIVRHAVLVIIYLLVFELLSRDLSTDFYEEFSLELFSLSLNRDFHNSFEA